ncbi:MAG: VIT and VWA domain-containing protein [Pseudomonadota bacterium]
MNIKFKKCWVFLITGFIVFCVCQTGFAESKEDKTLSPYFYVENGDASVDNFPLEETDVKVNITGVIAEVVVTQKYKNNGIKPISARYIFPASTRAAVHGMKMMIGDEVITAKIEERQAAQIIFDTAKKQGKSASLLKQQRPNVFSMNVANIMPNTSILVELSYTELLVPTDGIYSFVYPTVVGPRYSSQSEANSPETDLWVKNPYLKEGSLPRTHFNINAHVSTGIALQEVICTSHETNINYKSDSFADISLKDPEDFAGNRDYILKYRLADEKIESGLLLYEGKDENFFLLMVQPPESVLPKDIPGREYIFVVDVSGSMHGFPLNTSKILLKNLIGKLKPTDKFNVILFAGRSNLMSSTSLPANTENINQAIRLIDGQSGGGGTNLYAALKKAMDIDKDESFSRSIVIVTDGYITAEKDVFDLIHNNLNRTNVFSFGIGSSVNRYLIEGIAKAGLGEPFVVTKPEEAYPVSEKFRQYIQSPVLTGISLNKSGFEAYDIEPESIPDLFAKRPVVVFGKYRNNAKGVIEVRGQSGSGEYVQAINVSDAKPLETNHALKYLWARTRIAQLSDFNFNYNSEENKKEVTSLGISYNLLTANTSFVAVREVVVNPEGQSKDVNQPLPLPKNVSNLAVGGSMASVPEPDILLLVIAFGFITGGVLMLKKGFTIYKNKGNTFYL